MSVVFIMFPPASGGNHCKNLLCLDQSFYNAPDFTTSLYTDGKITAHAQPGNNFNPVLLPIANQQDKSVIIHGHFAELATYCADIRKIANKKFILIAPSDNEDFDIIFKRSKKLNYKSNLDEYYRSEQFFLYQPEMCQRYFDVDIEDICCIKLSELHNSNLKSFDIIDRLNYFLDTRIDYHQAQHCHSIWHKNNYF